MNIKDRIDYLTDRLAEVKEERDYWKAEAERLESLLESMNEERNNGIDDRTEWLTLGETSE